MGRELFEKRKKEFIKVINIHKRLPNPREYMFDDNEDMRFWFDKLLKIDQFQEFIDEVNKVLGTYGKKILTDKDYEDEFINCIDTIKRIPLMDEKYFSDGKDMNTWYLNYRNRNKSFETIVYNNLPEYTDFDIASVWPLVKKEFINILKQLKRVPKHGEVILQNDIDVKVIYDKLQSYDPEFFEKLLLHLQTYNKKTLSIDERILELKKEVLILGYIPLLQESRFTDGIDMFTWYMKFKNKLPALENELTELITKETPKTKVNIYLIPNFKNRGGKFYTICTNVGETLDLSNITSYEEAKKLDKTFTKRGGLILKKDEEIGTIGFGKGKSK